MLDITRPERVLIIGAGTGNDVAFSIRAGAMHIDAVEIDPVIYRTGLRLHPEAPYSSDVVEVHIDDGRSFMESSTASYDVILFAITDSLTNVSGRSSLRLESFLFTRESISRSRELLSDTGVVAMYHTYSEPWVIERMGRTFQEVFDQQPCFRQGDGVGGVTIAAGDIEEVCSPDERRGFTAGPDPSTDDHPFLYLRERGIPGFYLGSVSVLLLVSIGALRVLGGNPKSATKYLDLFFLGAAFLLLETKGVVQFSLWFGNTWVVNALVFSSILISVLLAIEVAERRKAPPLPALYLLLTVALGLAWVTPADTLLSLDQVPRFIAAGALLFVPVFTANLIFAERFRDTAQTTVAFGANLLGAMVGGFLEYLSLAIGYRALTLLVVGLYAAAFVSWRVLRRRV